MEELLGVYVPSPRDDFAIREVFVDTALRPDPLPGIDYSFNPYVGCYHACAFCYVPRLLRTDRFAWGASVVVKRNAATALAREVRRLPRGLVAISTATDPYQFVEGKYRITRRALEVLLRADWPVSVLSRAPLMARDVDLFTRFTAIEVGMSVPTLDDGARALVEPWAPPIEARLRCLRDLADAGLVTFVGFAPAYPPTDGWTPDGIADTFAAAGVRKVFTRPLDARWGVREAMLARLRDSPLAVDLARMTDRAYMGGFVESVAMACRERGIEFRPAEEFRQTARGAGLRAQTYRPSSAAVGKVDNSRAGSPRGAEGGAVQVPTIRGRGMPTQFTVKVSNKPGELGKLATALGDRRVNIRTLASDVVGDQGVLRFLVSDEATARTALKDAGFSFTEREALIARVEDRPGTLGQLGKNLGAAGVNIETLIPMPPAGGPVQIVLVVDDPAKAKPIVR